MPTDESIDDAAWKVVLRDVSITSGYETRLDQGTTYAVQVRARNAGGVGPGTATRTATTETLKVSITQSGATTVTEGQQSLSASNTNRPVYSIAASPLAVEADLTVNLMVTDPDGLVTGRIGTTATVAKGQTSATWEFLTNQNQAVNTAEKVGIALAPGTGYQIDAQADSIEYTVNDDDATPARW